MPRVCSDTREEGNFDGPYWICVRQPRQQNVSNRCVCTRMICAHTQPLSYSHLPYVRCFLRKSCTILQECCSSQNTYSIKSTTTPKEERKMTTTIATTPAAFFQNKTTTMPRIIIQEEKKDQVGDDVDGDNFIGK